MIEDDELVFLQARATNDLKTKPFAVQLIVVVFLLNLGKDVVFI